MVTHDVDEAVLLSDRIVMLTNGPAATIGDIIDVDLARPRERLALVDDTAITSCAAACSNSSTEAIAAGGVTAIMTPQQISLVTASWQKVMPISDTAAELFYGKLFEMDPALKPLLLRRRTCDSRPPLSQADRCGGAGPRAR